MKGRLTALIPLLIAGALVAKVSFASFPDNYLIERECQDVVEKISRVMDGNGQDACVGDLAIAKAYVNAASLKIEHHKLTLALTSIKYAENELKAVASTRSYCAKLAPLTKPILAHVITIGSEMEVMAHLQSKRVLHDGTNQSQ